MKNLKAFENYTLGEFDNEKGLHFDEMNEAKKACEGMMESACKAMYEYACQSGENCLETYESMCERLDEMASNYADKCNEFLSEMED